ncbi:TonB-dependent receptor [Pleionea litopenaei]|uniref:TonB-dependent receptor n=1 Tax=Pleionea litopenaei TaxID=3070815 RepID=A0AA51RU64_9GAMM|nr:TonB-dependent receptor [Pleionea sp. HL-JVS1]WMS87553.1 TonB-dependent receptor [Pleionea sp. HL-JVS1]
MNNKSFRWKVLALSVATICSGSVLAAEDTQEDQKDKKVKKAEIPVVTVTARRSVENLQEVPVAITALSDLELEANGVELITEVQRFSPNTTLQKSRGTNSTMTAFIRGVGQQDPLWGYEPGVGIYIDDVYIARPQGAVLDILNIERVEVLRGPQGTLYGKNTIGGAVKYVTIEMTGDAEFGARATIGSFNQRDVKVTGQIPVASNFYVGFGAASLNRDGFGEFLELDLPGQDLENYHKDVAATRLTMEYRPTESLFFRAKWDKTVDDSNAKGGYRLLPSLLTNAPVPDSVYDSYTSLPTFNKVEVEGFSLTSEWLIDENSSIKYIVASRENYSPTNIDFDNTALRIFDVPAVYDDEQQTQELQYNYSTDGLKVVAGYYYYNAESCGVFDAILEEYGQSLSLPSLTREVSGCSHSQSNAVFAQTSFDLDEQWSMTAGIRYTKDEKAAVVRNGLVFATVYPYSGWVPGYVRPAGELVPVVLNDSDDWSRFTPRIGVEYQYSDDIMLFASYAEGFKSGTFNPRASTAEPAADPEVVNSFEVGMKSDWGDNFRANVTLFMLEHKDRQYISVLPGDNAADLNQRLGNIGLSEASGLEAELTYVASDNLTLEAAFGYIDSDFKEVIDTDPNTGLPFDKSDRFTIANTPDLTMNLNAKYVFESSMGDFVVNGGYYYRGDYVLFEEDSLLTQDGYGLVNLGVNWYSNTSNLTVGLHIKNLTDEEYKIGGYQFVTPDPSDPTDISLYTPGLGGDNTLIAYYGDPRTVSLSFGYQF